MSGFILKSRTLQHRQLHGVQIRSKRTFSHIAILKAGNLLSSGFFIYKFREPE